MLGYFGTVASYVHHHSSEVARRGRDQIYPDIIWLEFVLDPMMLPLFCLWSLNPYWFIPMFLNSQYYIDLSHWIPECHENMEGSWGGTGTPKSSRSLDHLSLETYGWLVVSTYLLLWKICLWKSVGMMTFPRYIHMYIIYIIYIIYIYIYVYIWEVIQNSMVPNHQPDGILGMPHPEHPPFIIIQEATPRAAAAAAVPGPPSRPARCDPRGARTAAGCWELSFGPPKSPGWAEVAMKNGSVIPWNMMNNGGSPWKEPDFTQPRDIILDLIWDIW